jgi:hypothetical protein
MKSMADSLTDLAYAVSDHNHVLNVLQELNKQYNHLWAIITRTTSSPFIHKVWDDLVLRNSCSAPTHPHLPRRRSTATTLLPLLPLLRLIPLAMAPRVKDRGVTVAAIVRTTEATVATAAAVAATLPIRATRASPALPWLPDLLQSLD